MSRPAAVRSAPGGRDPLWPLALVSGAMLADETALTRYFAVAKWSEYGYWVISIAMAGLAVAGLGIALGRGALDRHGDRVMRWLPPLLAPAAGLGYWLAIRNPFNPLLLQNPATWRGQLGFIALYDLELMPFFALAGAYVGLMFVRNPDRVGRVYAADLAGAAAGALALLVAMRLLGPFQLVPALLPALAAACLASVWRARLAALVLLAVAECVVLGWGHPGYDQFKPIYAPLHVPGGRVLARINRARGTYVLMDDFTERADADLSNNLGLLHLPGPPRSFGLYRDGLRIASLPGPAGLDVRYAPGALSALPFVLVAHARVLLVGSSGGFGPAAARALGAADVTVLEPDPVLRAAERHGLGPARAPAPDARVRLLGQSPQQAARPGAGFGIIALAGDYLDEAEIDQHGFTVQAVARYLGAIAPDGVVAIPISIREFPAYAVRMLATVRAALLARGPSDPARQVVVVRSAWNALILVRRTPWPAGAIATVRAWADDRSFDVSYYPGIDVAAARAGLYNDLPPVSFESGTVAAGEGPRDAIADEAGAVLAGRPTPSDRSFDLAPITEARPTYHDLLRLARPGLILRRIELLPQAEIGPLVNLAVLAEALALALLTGLAPLVRGRARRGKLRPLPGLIVYFGALGLGFLFIEIAMIEKVAVLLNDRASAFSLVLASMLGGSGLGSLAGARLAARVRPRAWGLAFAAIVALCVLYALTGPGVLLALETLPEWARGGAAMLALLLISVPLGLPFPLGLGRIAAADGFLLPWAWALNGAFSVVATPLANLIGITLGLPVVLLGAGMLYGMAYVALPEPA